MTGETSQVKPSSFGINADRTVLAEPALVGRDRELKQLQTYLDSAKAGKGTTVFISGEAGSGKTRLVTEFLKDAKRQAVTILSGWCLSNAAVPYFPFFEAFNQYFSLEQAENLEMKNWLLNSPQAESFGKNQTITPQVWKDQTFTAVSNTISQISFKKPVILFIDDLQWADSASLALIHYLSRSIGSEKTLILATFRSEQLVTDADGRPTPLLETLRLMKRDDSVREITLSSLDESGVSHLAKNMLGADLQADLEQKLEKESQGNPLFVVESLRMLHERKSLILEADKWHLISNSIGIPPKIKDVILQRLAVLSRPQRNMLDLASIIGEKFDSQLLALVAEQDSIEIIKELDTISKNTSLVICEGELYRFDHGRTRDALYDDISSVLKKVYHTRVAETLESLGESDKFLLNDLAYQYGKAGNKEKAIKYALAAGQDALAKWSNIEAAKQFAFVVQYAGEDSKYSQERKIALEGLGDAYYASDNFAQAIKVLDQLADLQTGSDKLRALRKAMHAAFYQADISVQKKLFAKAEGIETADRLEAARILHLKSTVFMAPTEWETTGNVWKEVLNVYDEEYAISDAAYVLLWLGFGQACIGSLEEATAYALRSIALYDDLGDFRSQIEAYAYAGGTFQACKLDEEAFRMFAKAVKVNEEYKIWDYVRLFPAYVWEALALLGQDVPAAILKAKKALEYFQKTDSHLYEGAINGVLLVGYAFGGDTEHVKEYYQRFMSLPDYILKNAPTQVYFGPTMLVYHAAIGEYDVADKIFVDWMQFLKTHFQGPFIEASSRQLYAWALSKQGRLEEAQQQFAQVQQITAATRQRFIHTNIIPNIMTKTRPNMGETFPLRLDLINVSQGKGSIVKIENLHIPELDVLELSPNCVVDNGAVQLRDPAIGPFEVKTVKLVLKARAPAAPEGVKINPRIVYVDDLRQEKVCNPRPLIISAKAEENIERRLKVQEHAGDAEVNILKRYGLAHSTGKT